MTIDELSEQFDLLYNNITSNQAPGLTEYEKSVFLTKAEKEVIKNYFSPNSKGNNLQQGFDDSAKRQADFSMLLVTKTCEQISETLLAAQTGAMRLDNRSKVYKYPNDVFIVINETLATYSKAGILQIIPLRYDEYTRLMSKPYKRPLKNQAWRLMNSGSVGSDTSAEKGKSTKYVEIIVNSWDEDKLGAYSVRYIKTPAPILLEDFTADGLSIDGVSTKSAKCELDPILHEDVLQRAVELAKIAWTQTGQDNTQAVMQAGQRSE